MLDLVLHNFGLVLAITVRIVDFIWWHFMEALNIESFSLAVTSAAHQWSSQQQQSTRDVHRGHRHLISLSFE